MQKNIHLQLANLQSASFFEMSGHVINGAHNAHDARRTLDMFRFKDIQSNESVRCTYHLYLKLITDESELFQNDIRILLCLRCQCS